MTRRQLTSDDCKRCGVCCVSLLDSDVYANTTPEDEARLGKRFVRLNVINGAIKTRWGTQKSGPLKGVDACSCVALRGSLLKQVSCSIYKNRPEVCKKAVKPGDRTCLGARRLFREMLEKEGLDDGVVW